MDFGDAIKLLKQGKRIKREGWNGKNQYIELATKINYINANKEIINAEHEEIGNKAIAFVKSKGGKTSEMEIEDLKILFNMFK